MRIIVIKVFLQQFIYANTLVYVYIQYVYIQELIVH